jgi:hypothetical protein
MPYEQNAGKNHNIKMGESVAKFKIFGMTLNKFKLNS